jgi:hypothetical protein
VHLSFKELRATFSWPKIFNSFVFHFLCSTYKFKCRLSNTHILKSRNPFFRGQKLDKRFYFIPKRSKNKTFCLFGIFFLFSSYVDHINLDYVSFSLSVHMSSFILCLVKLVSIIRRTLAEGVGFTIPYIACDFWSRKKINVVRRWFCSWFDDLEWSIEQISLVKTFFLFKSF